MSIFKLYQDFRYIYPPRPESVITPQQLSHFDEGWIAQPKYNGSCAVVFINGRQDYKIYNRFGSPLTLQRPLDYTSLNVTDNYMVLSGEYLNKNKDGEAGTTFNHKFVIWDILVYDSVYLLGSTFSERLLLLQKYYGASRAKVSETSFQCYNHLLLTTVEGIYRSPVYETDFVSLYSEIIQTDIYEGLVLKKADARLEPGLREKNNSSWQVKVRKKTKSYAF